MKLRYDISVRIYLCDLCISVIETLNLFVLMHFVSIEDFVIRNLKSVIDSLTHMCIKIIDLITGSVIIALLLRR